MAVWVKQAAALPGWVTSDIAQTQAENRAVSGIMSILKLRALRHLAGQGSADVTFDASHPQHT